MNRYQNYNQQNYNEQQLRKEYYEYLQNEMRENTLRRREKNSLIATGIAIGAALIVQLIIEIILVSALKPLNIYELFNSSSLFQNCYNVLVADLCGLGIPFTVLAIVFKKRFVTPLVPTKKLGAAKASAWVALGMGGCLIANIATNGVIKLFDFFGYELTQPELVKPDSVIALFAVVVSTAIAPAIFEEYAFRCCTLGVLRRYGKGFAVFAVSIIFGLIHANVIQFIFAFMVGLILGYITVVTDNVIPAMFIHGLNNGISVTSDFITYFAGEAATKSAEVYLIVGWALLAIAGLVYLVVHNSLTPQKEEKSTQPKSRLSFGTKLLCLLPGLALPITILILLTTQYIQRK